VCLLRGTDWIYTVRDNFRRRVFVFQSSQRVESVLWMMTSLAFDHAQLCGARLSEGMLGVLNDAKRKFYLDTKSVLLCVLVTHAVSAPLPFAGISQNSV